MECEEGRCFTAFLPRFHTLVPASFDPKASAAAGCCFASPPMFTKKFRSLQQQSLPLKSIYTDSTIPTLKFSSHIQAAAAFDETLVPSNAGAEQRPESTSESGWTSYFDQSADSRCMTDERDGDSSMVREDPSMASDASSGPEQPDSTSQKRSTKRRNVPRKNQKKVRKSSECDFHEEEDEMDDTCQSNLSCESVSNDPGPDRRQPKRRKLVEAVDNVCSQQPDSEIGEGHSDENEVEIDQGEIEICSQPDLNSIGNAVDSRLELLQHLIPDGLELDEEQVLEVAIDYVKCLEKKIKMFDVTKRLNPESSKTCLSLLNSSLQDNPGLIRSMVAT